MISTSSTNKLDTITLNDNMSNNMKSNIKDYINKKQIKLTIFGDSIPEGVYLDEILNIKKLDNPFFLQLSQKYNLLINNKSCFGQTLARIDKKKLIEDYIENAKNDSLYQHICVLWIGGNDSDYDWHEVEKEPLSPHGPKTSQQTFEKILKEKIDLLKSNHIKTFIFTLFPIDSNHYFNHVLSLKYDGNEILKFLNGDLTNLNRHQEIFNSILLKIAYQSNVEVIDIRTFFLNKINMLSFLSHDGIHPNALAQNELLSYFENNLTFKNILSY